jgi:hypothetical protein
MDLYISPQYKLDVTDSLYLLSILGDNLVEFLYTLSYKNMMGCRLSDDIHCMAHKDWVDTDA